MMEEKWAAKKYGRMKLENGHCKKAIIAATKCLVGIYAVDGVDGGRGEQRGREEGRGIIIKPQPMGDRGYCSTELTRKYRVVDDSPPIY